MTSKADKETLLSLARSAIEAKLAGRRVTGGRLLPAGRGDPEGSGGAFVTLKKGSGLRGCIGLLSSDAPISETIVEMACSAAFEDPRFPPLTEDELPALSIEISRLSAFFPIKAEDVEVGTHGLLLRLGRSSGLLLPQVPLEQGWDRQTYLSGLCRKAGLPEGAWEDPRAELEAFTAEVFGED